MRSSFVWAELHVTPLNPAAKHCSALVRRVADDLARAGWKLEAISTDNGSEFRSGEFRAVVAALGAAQRFIRAGRPQTNGCVERVQRVGAVEVDDRVELVGQVGVEPVARALGVRPVDHPDRAL